MENRDVLASLDQFSNNLMLTLADVEALKKQLLSVVEENVALQIENTKLRDRLDQLANSGQEPNRGLANLVQIYEDGFHICNNFYGQRQEPDEACMFCLGLLNKD